RTRGGQPAPRAPRPLLVQRRRRQRSSRGEARRGRQAVRGAAAMTFLPGLDVATPLMQQYREIKARHRNAILLFRMGDFYEMFDEDAHVGARALGLTLTSRN